MTCHAFLVLFFVSAGNSAAAKVDGADKPAGIPPSVIAVGTASDTPASPTAPPSPAPPVHAPSAESETASAPIDPKASVGGTITVPDARKDDVKKGDIIFLVARRAGGPPGPGSMLAVQKLIAGDFPMKFALSGRDAMIPGTPFEGEVSITARVDKDGDAMTRKKGDVFGSANNIKVGTQDVVIPLDALQTEDKILGAPGMAAPSPRHP